MGEGIFHEMNRAYLRIKPNLIKMNPARFAEYMESTKDFNSSAAYMGMSIEIDPSCAGILFKNHEKEALIGDVNGRT